MKKLVAVFVIAATLVGTSAHAQPTGGSAAAAKNSGSNDFAWGIALGGLAVVGVVVGITAAAASNSTSSFSH